MSNNCSFSRRCQGGRGFRRDWLPNVDVGRERGEGGGGGGGGGGGVVGSTRTDSNEAAAPPDYSCPPDPPSQHASPSSLLPPLSPVWAGSIQQPQSELHTTHGDSSFTKRYSKTMVNSVIFMQTYLQRSLSLSLSRCLCLLSSSHAVVVRDVVVEDVPSPVELVPRDAAHHAPAL